MSGRLLERPRATWENWANFPNPDSFTGGLVTKPYKETGAVGVLAAPFLYFMPLNLKHSSRFLLGLRMFQVLPML
jgi:hypothetical protein